MYFSVTCPSTETIALLYPASAHCPGNTNDSDAEDPPVLCKVSQPQRITKQEFDSIPPTLASILPPVPADVLARARSHILSPEDSLSYFTDAQHDPESADKICTASTDELTRKSAA